MKIEYVFDSRVLIKHTISQFKSANPFCVELKWHCEWVQMRPSLG